MVGRFTAAPRRLASICARGGSKGVPDKNLAEIAGRTLLNSAVTQARLADAFVTIAVSSDSDRILEEGQRAGACLLVKRPNELATDSSGKLGAIVHLTAAAEQATGMPYDLVVDLDVSCPLRPPSLISRVIAQCEQEQCASVLTAAAARRSPYFNLVEIDASGSIRLCRQQGRIESRQSAPLTYDLFGTAYAWQREMLIAESKLIYPQSLLHVMPAELALDIDGPFDLAVARLIVEHSVVDIGL